MRTFKLVRTEDASGVSGTGDVAEGVEFDNGKCVMCWDTDTSSIAIYEDVDDLVKIHGHQGRTKVIFSDGEVVSDMLTPEEILEQFVESGLEISADGFSAAIQIEDLLERGSSWEEATAAVGYDSEDDAEQLKVLYLIAKTTGVI